jgi:hypothetical protein
MAQTLLARRIWIQHPYVLPAKLLSSEPTHDEDLSSLHADASQDDRCYVRFIRSFDGSPPTAQCAVSARLLIGSCGADE